MTYTSDLPLAGESLGSTRDRIRGNFQEIAAVEAINHVAFNATGKGKHKFLQMPEVTASGAGVPPVAVNEGGVYVDVGANPAEANLFFRAENNGFNYQLTKSNSSKTSQFAVNNPYGSPPANFTQVGGWTFLPGGMLLQYGFYGKSGSLGSSGTIQFPIAFTNVPYSVTATIERAAAGGGSGIVVEVTGSISTTSFGFSSSTSSSDGIFWMAVGI